MQIDTALAVVSKFAKTKIPFWLKVLALLAASTLIGESVQAQFNFQAARDAAARDRAYRSTWNNGGNRSQPSGPSPAQVEQQQRSAAATAQNEQGISAYNNGDWAAAEADFQKALENSPNNQVMLRNLANSQAHQGEVAYKKGDYATALKFFQQALANDPVTDPDHHIRQEDFNYAQEKLADAKRVQEQQQKDKVTANNIQQSIQSLTQSLSSAPPPGGLDFNGGKSGAPAPGKANSGGLDFIDSDPNVVDLRGAATTAVDPARVKGSPGASSSSGGDLAFIDPNAPLHDAVADAPSDHKTSGGYFGSKNAKPDDLTTDHQGVTSGTSTKADDQVKSVTFHSLQAAKDSGSEKAKNDASKGFDQLGENKQHLAVAAVATPPSAPEDIQIPAKMLNDPVVRQLITYKQQAQESHEAAAAAQTKFEAEQKKDPHSAQLVMLQEKAKEAQDKAGNLDNMVKVQTGEVKKKISFGKIDTGGEASKAAQGQTPQPTATSSTNN